MPSKTASATTQPVNPLPPLSPQQVCFVVDDVLAAVQWCEERFGWGPFYQFKAPVAEASYRAWRGEKLTEVALGMAGKVQVEFLHVHLGRDTTGDYQQAYGTGFQHIGIHCQSRDAALDHLVAVGATVNELNEYPGIRFAFVDTPTGNGMFEILQPTEALAANAGISSSRESRVDSKTLFDIDRATVVTDDIDEALTFYARAFGWVGAKTATATLAIDGTRTRMRRHIGTAGKLQIELIETDGKGDNPYAAHLRRGNHGLIHAGGQLNSNIPLTDCLRGEWLETGESFALYDWPGGERALQIRRTRA